MDSITNKSTLEYLQTVRTTVVIVSEGQGGIYPSKLEHSWRFHHEPGPVPDTKNTVMCENKRPALVVLISHGQKSQASKQT